MARSAGRPLATLPLGSARPEFDDDHFGGMEVNVVCDISVGQRVVGTVTTVATANRANP